MANEIIGRLHNIGLGKETVAGTAVSATRWLPKVSGALKSKFTTARQTASVGVIDGVNEVLTTEIMSEIDVEGILHDIVFGDLLMAAFGTTYPCVKVPIPGSITGTFVEGETITEATSAAKGTLRRLDAGGTSKILYIDNPTIGTFTVTIASPGVFSITGHGLVAGDSVYFTTTGALPTGLSVNTNYFVIAGGLTADAFEVSATSGGSAINTSGSQSGTHTCYRGKFTGGLGLTGGTSGATATGGTVESIHTVRSHIFRRLNTNNHPSYTVYGKDTEADERAAYCLLDSLEIDIVVGEYATFKAMFKGKSHSSTSSTASYTSQNPFLAKSATFKHAADHDSLDAASAVSVRRLKLIIEKNVEPYYALGSNTPASLHNKEFIVRGDVELLYNEITTRDYLTNSTARAMRLTITNPTTIGSAANPTFQIDLPVVRFEEWDRSTDNAELVTQTLGFVATFDLTTRSLSAEAILQNTSTSAY